MSVFGRDLEGPFRTGFDFCRRLRGNRQAAPGTPKFALSCKVGRVDSAERARPVLRAGVAMGT